MENGLNFTEVSENMEDIPRPPSTNALEEEKLLDIFNTLSVEDEMLNEEVKSNTTLIFSSGEEKKYVEELKHIGGIFLQPGISQNKETEDAVSFVTKFLNYGRNAEVQAWALNCVNKMSFSPALRPLLNNDIVTPVMMALTSNSRRIRVKAAETLGLISIASSELHDRIFKRGVLPIVLSFVDKDSSVSEIAVVIISVYQLIFGKFEPAIALQVFKFAASILIKYKHPQLTLRAARLLSTASCSIYEPSALVRNTGLVSTLIEFTAYPNESLAALCLKIVEEAIARSAEDAKAVLNAGGFDAFKACLCSKYRQVRFAACRVLLRMSVKEQKQRNVLVSEEFIQIENGLADRTSEDTILREAVDFTHNYPQGGLDEKKENHTIKESKAISTRNQLK
eukprot:TRINITY_DN1908_c0_g2_i1.p1 TRINITY_DN1908_c0_g2~~TRINITY_DN1908_c0_g2_i1.p1  ORF type:complete len:395 (-),score=50.45 TRINITY_DN1908_c0_g2_i1:151-1335(-)